MISIDRIIELRKAHTGDHATPWSQTIAFGNAIEAETIMEIIKLRDKCASDEEFMSKLRQLQELKI
jgi:hypothetical protein